jgi:non-ribosomal peptide synthetase component F
MPFERLVELLSPRRDLGHSPLFQAPLALGTGGEETPELAGCRVEPVAIERREAHFELTLFAGEADDGGLELALTYDRDLFDAATVERLAGHLASLLAAGCAEPSRELSALPWLPQAELRQVAGWELLGSIAQDGCYMNGGQLVQVYARVN